MVRIPSELVEIGGRSYQFQVSPQVADIFKNRARRLGLTEEELLSVIHGQYGELTERIIYGYLRVSG